MNLLYNHVNSHTIIEREREREKEKQIIIQITQF